MEKIWLWIIAAVAAFFVKGLCGFANTLVFTSVLGFGINNVNISPVDLILGYPANLIMIWKNRKKLNPKVCVPLIVIVLAGSIPGAFLLKAADAKYLKILFGAVVVFIGAEMLLNDAGKIRLRDSKITLTVIGLLLGIFCGLFGVGALLAAYIGRVAKTSDEFKGNISAVFAAENTFRILTYSILGVITLQSLKQVLLMVPFMLLGLFAGMKSAKYLDERKSRKLVIILLILSGFILIINNL